MHTCTDRIVEPYWHVFGLGQTADDNTETFLYQGNYNSLLQSWLGKDYWAGSKFPALNCIVGSGSWGGITATQLRERDVWRELSKVFNPIPASGEQWLSLVGFTRGDTAQIEPQWAERVGCFGKREECTETGGWGRTKKQTHGRVGPGKMVKFDEWIWSITLVAAVLVCALRQAPLCALCWNLTHLCCLSKYIHLQAQRCQQKGRMVVRKSLSTQLVVTQIILCTSSHLGVSSS